MTRRVLRGFSAERFRFYREHAGFSRGDLARVAGISSGAIYGWETESASPQIDVLAKAVGALGATLADVILLPAETRFLSDLRVLAGLTQPQLASTVDISTTRLSNVERGEAPLGEDLKHRLAAAVGVDPVVVQDAYDRVRARPPGTSP